MNVKKNSPSGAFEVGDFSNKIFPFDEANLRRNIWVFPK